MAKYLLACACGREHAVETRQAGESIPCDCGTRLEVPTLRKLRELPLAGEVEAAAGPAWGARQGAMTACLLVVAASLVVAAACRLTEVPLPTIDPVKYSASVDQLVSNMTPLEAWERWVDTYQPLATTGFEIYRHPASAAIQLNLDWHRWIEWVALGLAAVFGGVAGAIGLAGGTKSKVS
jgi:hypothetical protein